jgi:glutamate-1-semialdehyde aminotransferase
VLVFHSHAVHRALPNRSARVRLSLDARVQPARAPRTWQATHSMLEMRALRARARAVADAAALTDELFERVFVEMPKRGVPAEREPMLALAAELEAGRS